MPFAELDHIADQILVLDEMRPYLSKTVGSSSGGSYNNRFISFPWNPPHAFPSTTEYLDYYRAIFLEFCGPEFVEELISRPTSRSTMTSPASASGEGDSRCCVPEPLLSPLQQRECRVIFAILARPPTRSLRSQHIYWARVLYKPQCAVWRKQSRPRTRAESLQTFSVKGYPNKSQL